MRRFFDPRQLAHEPALELHNGGFVPYAETPARAEGMAEIERRAADYGLPPIASRVSIWRPFCRENAGPRPWQISCITVDAR